MIFEYPELCINKNRYQKYEKQAYLTINEKIQELIDYSETTDCQSVLISFPDLFSCQNLKYSKETYIDLINNNKSNDKILTIDILEFYQENKNSSIISPKDLYWPTDGHMTPLGFRMWTKITFVALFEDNFIGIGN